MALLESYRAGLSQWAKTEPLVKTVYVFGSFAKGTCMGFGLSRVGIETSGFGQRI